MLVDKYFQNLPSYLHRREIVTELFENDQRFLLVIGHTGSGKSTQIPQYMLMNLIKINQPKFIYCVQPRRIAAHSLCERVRTELGPLKYMCIMDSPKLKDTATNHPRIVFTTEALFLTRVRTWREQLMKGEATAMDHVAQILLDEVHERTFNMDIIVA
jgi:HrpA-like RNA helicase